MVTLRVGQLRAMTSRHLTVPGNLEEIETICNLVFEAAREAGLDERSNYAIQLAVAEACENIIKHGYGGEGRGAIDVQTQADREGLTVWLSDTAAPFDPTRHPVNKPSPRDDPPAGGLGLLILRRSVDKLRYSRRRGKNTLRLWKHRKADST